MSLVRPAGNVLFKPPPRAPPRVVPGLREHAFKIVLSANIAAGGEDTTTYGMTAPAGKSGTDFTTGRRWDNENGTDTLTIAIDDWTKVAWSIAAVTGVAIDTEQYEFRVVANNAALNTYTVTPRWTIGTPAADVQLPDLTMPPMMPAGRGR
jgi:hypothetical protein